MKNGNAVFAFILKNKSGQTEAWHIDLKEKGEVAKGETPVGKKADGWSIQSLASQNSLRNFERFSLDFMAINIKGVI